MEAARKVVKFSIADTDVAKLQSIARSRMELASRVERAQILLRYRDDPSHYGAALSAMTVKIDRKDARGIARLLRMGWYRPEHCKSPPSQDVRALLTARKLLLGKVIDVELGIRGLLRGFGLKMGPVSTGRFAARVRQLAAG